MTVLKITGTFALAYAAWFLPVAQAAPPALYASAQAVAGAVVFTQNCASCHGANLQGDEGPALIGQKFAAPGAGNTIGSIFSLITQQMPLTNPGGLAQTQYEDVMSYILSKNGYPSGNTALAYTGSLTSSLPLVSTVK